MNKAGIYPKFLPLIALILALITGGLLVHWMKRENVFHASADFEPVETIYMIWNEEDSAVATDIAAKISPFEHVTFFTGGAHLEEEKIKLMILKKGGNEKNITIQQLPQKPANSWIRDFSPVFMKNKKDLNIIKTRFWDATTDISEYLAHKYKIDITQSNIYSLGGTREFNGLGTGIFVEAHEKAANPEFVTDRKKFERSLKKEFNLKKIIWLKKGIPQDELPSYGPLADNIFPTGSNHHIDEFCRFIGPRQIMLSYITEAELNGDPILTEAKKRLDENYWILKNATDQDGNYFEIIPMPFAPIVVRPFHSTLDPNDFRTDVTSYMNFLITNYTVILPTYTHIDTTLATRLKEEFIVKMFNQHLPGKKVVFIHPGTLNSRGGGIHCITASKPAFKKKPAGNFKLRFVKRKRA